MAVERCYYEVLGVERTANGDEIKRSYRRLAMKWHPDRNPGDAQAEAEFKACAEAYEVLGDPERRARYDQHGHAGLRGTPGHDFNRMRPDDIMDMFAELFGGGRQRARRGPARGYDLEEQVEIDLADVLTGKDVEVAFSRLDVCVTCGGGGAKPGTKPKQCTTCGGRGQVEQIGLGGLFRMVNTCPACRGRGTVITDRCEECRGQGRISKRRSLRVKIPAGIDDGQVIRVTGEGEPPPPEASPMGQGERGDLHVVVRVNEHESFTRHGNELITARELSPAQAALGVTLDIESLDGPVQVEVPAGTQHGELVRVPDRGLPSLRSPRRGDLVVGFTIRIPEHLNARQRELYAELAQIEGDPVHEGSRSVWAKIKDTFTGS
jgi:molecular chaperone DnaJ